MRKFREILWRVTIIAALMSVFLIIGGPGGGGGGFGGGGSGGSGRSGSGGMSKIPYDPKRSPLTSQEQRIACWILLGVFGAGAIAHRFTSRKEVRSRTISNTLQPVTFAILLNQNTKEHVAFCDHLICDAGTFSTPHDRAIIARKLIKRITSVPLRRCFYTMLPAKNSATEAEIYAGKLAAYQISLVDKHRDNADSEATCCVIGFTMTLAPRLRAGLLDSSEDPEACLVVMERLLKVPKTSMDAFYFFYSPAQGKMLSVEQGEKMLADLQKLAMRGSPFRDHSPSTSQSLLVPHSVARRSLRQTRGR